MDHQLAVNKHEREKGVALILTLILMAVASVMAVSMMFLSSSETMNTANFRLMSQARDAAEAGVNRTANILMGYPQDGGFSYVPPSATSGTDPLGSYNTTVSPVTRGGAPVILATGNNSRGYIKMADGYTNALSAANYANGAVQTAFNTEDSGGLGVLSVGTLPVVYQSYAELLSMEAFIPAFSTTPTTLQTWRITSTGTVNNIQNSVVEVSAILDRPKGPAFPYALFAEGAVCGALDFNGTGADVDSYDSSNATQVAALLAGGNGDAYGGNVGTNGNMEQGGGSIVNGSLSTPNSGVGNCVNGSPNALDQNGGATVTGGITQLPQQINYDDPALPSPWPTPAGNPNPNGGNVNGSSDCTNMNNGGATRCSVVVANTTYTLHPTCSPAALQCPSGSHVFGNLNVMGGDTIQLTAGTYNINCIALTGNARVVLVSSPVILNMGGVGCGSNTAVDFANGDIINASLDPTALQIVYAGTAEIRIRGGAEAAALVNAPNSSVTLTGGSDFYGAIIGEEVTIAGGTDVHYDRRLQRMMYIAGPWVMSSFTWNKF